MATKAERFRYDVERSTSAKKKKATGITGHRPSQGRKAVYALEEVAQQTAPSRKSTRRSKNRQKAATALTSKNILTRTDPKHRHEEKRRASPSAR
jgi:hypothetical protein